jgi:hypothetical protein
VWTGPPLEHFPYGLRNATSSYVDALVPHRVGKEIVSEYASNSNVVPDYNSDSSYEFDFGSDPIESESEINTIEEPFSGPTVGLVITSAHAGRFVYWPDRKPADLTDDNSCCVTYPETILFLEGTPLTQNAEEYSPTEVASTNSELRTPDGEVFVPT